MFPFDSVDRFNVFWVELFMGKGLFNVASIFLNGDDKQLYFFKLSVSIQYRWKNFHPV
jgi:hypothetical protein